eukprot:COSAG03_NODE_27455_length_253_cov_0.662338_1_plen_32_part_01
MQQAESRTPVKLAGKMLRTSLRQTHTGERHLH